MSETKLPHTIDPVKFAEQRHYLKGSLSVADMPRLMELCCSDSATARVHLWLEGGFDEKGPHYLRGCAEVDVILMCQRCLKPLNYHLVAEFSLSPVNDETAAKQLPSSYEPLYLDGESVDLSAMIEDELLLALPIIPKHKDEGCAREIMKEKGLVGSGKKNPFAELSKLKKKD